MTPEFAEYIERRDEALLSLNRDVLVKLFEENGVEIPADETMFWAGIHMARLQVVSFHDGIKAESLGWLHANGFCV